MNKKTGYTILLILFTSIIRTPSASADGSVDTQEVWVEWKTSDWVGGTSSTNDKRELEYSAQATYVDYAFNFSALDIDTVNVTNMRAYIYWSDTNDAFSRDWYFSAWEYTAQEDAGARVHQDTWSLQNYDGTGNSWVSRAFSPMWSFTSNEYFFGVATEDQAGSVFVYQWESAPASSSWLHDKDTYGGDPFVEDWGTATGESDDIQVKYWGYKNDLTLFNQYYGDSENYIARRDVNYTFPSSSSSRKMEITLPNNEYLVNITRSNGGLWNETLSESDYTVSDYNSTHQLITISNSPLALYGGDYRLFTISYPYYYQFDGLYIENGTKTGNVNVTIHLPSGSNEYMIDGQSNYGFNEEPLQAVWSLEGGGSRRIYFHNNYESIKFFTPDDDYASYSFTIKDYTGSIGAGDTFLEALRIVNGTEFLIERALIMDAINAVPLTLTQNQIYILQIRLSDDSLYRFGYFIPSSDPTPTIIINQMPFSSQTHYLGEDISTLATRPTPTHIQLTYLDKSELTIGLDIEILFLNKTVAYTDSATGENSITFNWYNAHNESDFIVNLNIDHYLYGESSYTAWLLGEKPGLPDPPDIDSIIGAGATNGLSILLILSALVIGSRGGALISLILADVVTFILISVGLLTSPFGYGPPILVFVLIWVYAMGANRK